jgi:hypothetical protein
MGLSILVFAAWEIGKFQLIQMGAATFDQVVQEKFHTPEFETVAATAHVEHNAKISAFNRVQPIIFWVTALSGFGAGGLILWAAIRAATGVRLTFG